MSFEPCASSFVKDLPIQPLSARQHGAWQSILRRLLLFTVAMTPRGPAAPRLISPLFFCPRETIERLADLTGGDFRSGKRPARGCVTYRDMPRRRGGVVNGEAVRVAFSAFAAALAACECGRWVAGDENGSGDRPGVFGAYKLRRATEVRARCRSCVPKVIEM